MSARGANVEGTLIVDDCQILEIKAKMNESEDSETRFSVIIRGVEKTRVYVN